MVNFKDENLIFKGIIYEDDVKILRDHLNNIAPAEVTFDFTNSSDVHSSILQIILSYYGLYSAKFVYGETKFTYQKVIEGFGKIEDDCH